MQTRYHINIHGAPAKCNAENENTCPRTKHGSPHGDSLEEVQAINEKLNNRFVVQTLSKTPTKTELSDDEDRIYRAYRSILKKQPKGIRSAHRKNEARKKIVDRYNVPFQELKTIIATGDKRDNIEHPHDADYLKYLKFDEEVEELEESYSNHVGCPLCNEDDARSVRARMDPYESRVNNKLKPMYSCYVCYFEKEQEVKHENASSVSRFT